MARLISPAATVIVVVAFLTGCVSAPDAPDHPLTALESALAGSIPISGEAASGPDSWAFTLTGTSFDPFTGVFQAEIEWPSLNALHLVTGTLVGDILAFEEVDYILPGDAILNCQYVAQVGPADMRVDGTWGGCMGYEGTFWFVIP